MMRRLVKSGIACGLRWSGASLLIRRLRRRSGAPWIVGYHRVVEDFAKSAGATARVNVLGFAVLQVDWVKPLDRPGKKPFFQFNLLTGF